MTINRPLRVFLCHSSNDKPAIRELYRKLCAESWIQPWLDEEELYPGQDWNLEIEKAIKATDVIIVCLSNNSTTKEGYVQREIRIALDYADYKPEGTVFIIPIRLEDCKPPTRLSKWQYADYFEGQEEKAFQKLLVSLYKRADSLGVREEVEESKKEQFEGRKPSVEPVAVEETQTNSVRQKPSVKVPTVSGHPTLKSITTNRLILSNGMEFIRVPAGKFLMGSEGKGSYFDESPRHFVNIYYDYWLARFPVTNDLYNSYVKHKKLRHPVEDWRKKKDHPVVCVSWNDAVGYCQWLNSIFGDELPPGLVLRLPTEFEWEKAARGTDGRKFPWGNTFDETKFNNKSSGGGVIVTTSVSLYSPQGDSPYGCADMVGNVAEWTLSVKKRYPYKINDIHNDDEQLYGTPPGFRVLRGRHSVKGSAFGAHCAYRITGLAHQSSGAWGFRAVASLNIDAIAAKNNGFWEWFKQSVIG